MCVLGFFLITLSTFLEYTALSYIFSVWWDRGMFLSYLPYLGDKEVGWEAPLSLMLLHKAVGLFWLPDLTCVSQFLQWQRPPGTSGRIVWQDHPHTNRFGNTAGGEKQACFLRLQGLNSVSVPQRLHLARIQLYLDITSCLLLI